MKDLDWTSTYSLNLLNNMSVVPTVLAVKNSYSTIQLSLATSQPYRPLDLRKGIKPPMAREQFAAGTLIADRYRLTAPLGAGAQGTVWEGLDLRDGTLCALKFTSHHEAQSEFAALTQVAHRSLPKAIGVTTHNGSVVLVSERITGTTLDREQDPAAVVRALFDCADALTALHDRGMVHGDIKPANILMNPSRAWLVDLGFAGEAQQQSIAGTLAFLAPEAFAGERSCASDMFSLGVTAVLTLTQGHPFVEHAQQREALLDALAAGLNVRGSVREKIPASLLPALLPLLSQEPNARGSAQTLMARLNRDVGPWLTAPQRARAKASEPRDEGSLVFFGRNAELERAKHALLRVLNERSAVGIVVTGREGSGRARFVQEILRVARVICAAKGKTLTLVDHVDSLDGPTVLLQHDADSAQLTKHAEAIERLRKIEESTAFAPLFVLATSAEQSVPSGYLAIELRPLDREQIAGLVRSVLGRAVSGPAVDEAYFSASDGLPGRCVRLLRALSPELAATATKSELAKIDARAGSAAAVYYALSGAERALFLKLAISHEPWPLAEFSQHMAELRQLGAQLAARAIAKIENRAGVMWLSLESPVSIAELTELPTLSVSAAADAVLALHRATGGLTAIAEALACYFSADPMLRERAATVAIELARQAGQSAAARIEWLRLATVCRPGEKNLSLGLTRALMWGGHSAEALQVLSSLPQDAETLLLQTDVLRLSGESTEVASLLEQLAVSPSIAVRAVARVIEARGCIERGEWTAALSLLSDQETWDQFADATRIRRGETLAIAQLNLGDAVLAQRTLTDLGPLVARCDEPRVIARVASMTAMVLQAQDDHRGARSKYSEAWTMADGAGDLRSAATYAANMGGAELVCGSLGSAKSWFDRAVRSLAAFGSPFEFARSLVNLASLEAFLGDRGRAHALAMQAEAVAVRVGDPHSIAMAKMTFAESKLSGKPLADALVVLASAEREQGRTELAEELFLHALVASAQGNDSNGIRLALAELKALNLPSTGLTALVADAIASVALDESSQHTAVERAKEALASQEVAQLDLWVLQWGVRAAQRQSESAFRRAKSQFDAKINALAATLSEANVGLFRDAHRLESGTLALMTTAEPSGGELRWRRLAEIARELNSETRLRPLLERIMDAVVELTGGSRGFLLLAAPDGALRVRTARKFGRSDLADDETSPSRSIAERVAKTGEALFSVDASSDRRLSTFESVASLQLRSVLAVPLVIHGHSCGTIYVDDRFKVGAFGDSALEVAHEFAEIAAVAIHNARNGARLRRALRQSERLQKKLAKRVVTQGVELEATRRALTAPDEVKGRYEGIVGRGHMMRKTLSLCDRVAATAVSVLLLGETGTGKELIARAIHANSPRAKKPFVAINCGALTEALLESELFGHLRGAFTGADRARQGLFEVAHGGTIFLDEVAEMSQSMQTKLLRVLQEGEVRPVGGTVARKVDVRVIAATHRDVVQMVAARTFREDLYYRLAVMTLAVPPLRERKEDIPELVAHVLQKHHRPEVKIDRKAMVRLIDYAWPGNVRQLENELQRAALLSDGTIHESDLDARLVTRELDPAALERAPLDLRAAVAEVERAMVERALKEHRGNQTRAAVALGVSRFGLQKMLKRLGITERTAN